jgi:hypothetical protein
VTQPVIDAGFLAPIIASLDKLEVAVHMIREVVDRQMGDVGHLDVQVEGLEEDVRELRAILSGKGRS